MEHVEQSSPVGGSNSSNSWVLRCNQKEAVFLLSVQNENSLFIFHIFETYFSYSHLSHSWENGGKFLKGAACGNGFLMSFWPSFHLQRFDESSFDISHDYLQLEVSPTHPCKDRKLANGGLHVCSSVSVVKVIKNDLFPNPHTAVMCDSSSCLTPFILPSR